MEREDSLHDFEEDLSDNIIFKVSFVFILFLIIYNTIDIFIYYSFYSLGSNFLTILINSSFGIILGFAIYNSAIFFNKRIGEYAGIARIIFDFINIFVNLYYSNYLNDLFYSAFLLIFLSFNVIVKQIIFFLLISMFRPVWIEFLELSVYGLNLCYIFLFLFYFQKLGKEKDNFHFKMTSIAYVISFCLLISYFIFNFDIFYLSSKLVENIFLAISFNIFLTTKFKFIEELNPNYRPIRTEYK